MCAGIISVFALSMTGTVASAADGGIAFRIGTGGVNGTYYPMGAHIAKMFNAGPEGSPYPNAVPQASSGSVGNIDDLVLGEIEGALAQADIVALAARGTEMFSRPQMELRHVASLYPESLHVVVRKEQSATRIQDLRGYRVSMAEQKSGTYATMRRVFDGLAMKKADFQPVYLNAKLAAERIADGRIDAFFLMAGAPTGSVKAILESGNMRLMPLSRSDLLLQGTRDPRLSPGLIPNTVYETSHDIETIQTMAQFLVMSSMDNDTVYAITRAIWKEASMERFRKSHSVAELMDVRSALRDATVPLHPGARRYYEEIGLLETARDTSPAATSYP